MVVPFTGSNGPVGGASRDGRRAEMDVDVRAVRDPCRPCDPRDARGPCDPCRPCDPRDARGPCDPRAPRGLRESCGLRKRPCLRMPRGLRSSPIELSDLSVYLHIALANTSGHSLYPCTTEFPGASSGCEASPLPPHVG